MKATEGIEKDSPQTENSSLGFARCDECFPRGRSANGQTETVVTDSDVSVQ